MQIFVGIDIKWIIRVLLGIFWAVAFYMAFTGNGFLTWLVTEHVYVALFISVLSAYFFIFPFLTLINGGDKEMERSTKILLFIIAMLVVVAILATAAIFNEGVKNALLGFTNAAVVAPIFGIIIAINNWLKAFEPLHVILVTGIGWLVFAVILNKFAMPRIRKTTAKVRPVYMDSPTPSPPITVQQTPTKTVVVQQKEAEA